MNKPPNSFYRAHSKRGDADCAIAALATITHRAPEEVLIAAAQVKPTLWTCGMSIHELCSVAWRLGCVVDLKYREQIEPTDTGVLWVSYHNSTAEHCVALVHGVVIDSEYNPAVVCRYEDYTAAMQAYGNALLMIKE